MKLPCDKSKLFCAVSFLTIISSFFLIVMLIYWATYPYKILTFGADNGKIINPKVQSGDYLEMQQDYCKYEDFPSYIDRQFIDSIIYQIPQSVNRRPTGCHNRIEQIYIPKAIPPGLYYISTNISFKVNPIRIVTVNVKTGMFEIVK